MRLRGEVPPVILRDHANVQLGLEGVRCVDPCERFEQLHGSQRRWMKRRPEPKLRRPHPGEQIRARATKIDEELDANPGLGSAWVAVGPQWLGGENEMGAWLQ